MAARFRVRDTGQMLVCKCRCAGCTDPEGGPSPHRRCSAASPCSVRRHLEKADRRAEMITARAAEAMRASMTFTDELPDQD